MTWFTDSSYERLMVQPPAGQAKAPVSPGLPHGHPCYGCPYGQNAPCLGICYKKLLKGSGKRVVGDR